MTEINTQHLKKLLDYNEFLYFVLRQRRIELESTTLSTPEFMCNKIRLLLIKYARILQTGRELTLEDYEEIEEIRIALNIIEAIEQLTFEPISFIAENKASYNVFELLIKLFLDNTVRSKYPNIYERFGFVQELIESEVEKWDDDEYIAVVTARAVPQNSELFAIIDYYVNDNLNFAEELEILFSIMEDIKMFGDPDLNLKEYIAKQNRILDIYNKKLIQRNPIPFI